MPLLPWHGSTIEVGSTVMERPSFRSTQVQRLDYIVMVLEVLQYYMIVEVLQYYMIVEVLQYYMIVEVLQY